ncbi:hypothetical protein SeMB42_g02481 [Synchytrium endobioticum]|uniref:Uncharacterized protein n=1 Tax=Synchytrium endobioticum TaxID=286115 RepID=A0A507D3H6_9FUNG|nr:hypothetical protein SeLEV6574_g03587 [Synchytrium endobioticum]TPX49766.1 hypothetical protein SeMB42_g02481 [Synchytrium endobioticum]
MSTTPTRAPYKTEAVSKKVRRDRIALWLNLLPRCLSEGRISNIERVAVILRHTEQANTARQKIGTCPGVTYVQDLLQNNLLHQVLASVDTSKLKWGPIVAALESGRLESLAKKGSEFDFIALESILLPIVYIAANGGESTPDALNDLPRRLARRMLGISRTSKLPTDTWASAFTEFAVRTRVFEVHQQGPLTSSVLMNELLEGIRIRKLQEEGFIAPSLLSNKIVDVPKGSEQRLASILSCSLYTVIEFCKTSEYMTVENLHVLAGHGRRLSDMWFTPEFLASTIYTAETLLIDGPSRESALKGVGAIATLWSVWIRKCDAWSASPYANSIISLLKQFCKNPSTDPTIILYSAVALLSSYPPSNDPEQNAESLNDLCSLLPIVYPRIPRSERDLTRASIAQVLRRLVPSATTTFCTAVLNGVSLAKPCDAYDVAQLIYLIQFGVTQQCDALPPVQRPWWRVWGETSAERTVPGFVAGILEVAQSVGGIYGSAAAAGLARSVFAAKPDPERFNLSPAIRREIFDRVFEIITAEVSKIVNGDKISVTDDVRESIAVICSSTAGTVSHHDDFVTLPQYDWKPILKESLAVLLRSPDTLSLPLDTVAVLESGNRKEELYSLLTQRADPKLRPFLYAEVSKMAYGIGLLTAIAWKDGDMETVEDVFSAILNFVECLSKSWESCSLSSNVPKTIEPTMPVLWSHFRTMLFCITSIFKHIADVLPDRPDLDSSEPLVKLFQTLRDIHFVTSRFGSEGFKAWQSVVSACCAWFRTHARRQIKVNHDDLVARLMNDVESGPYIEDNPVRKTRRTFSLLVSRQLARHLSNHIISQVLLPKCYPYLFLSYSPEQPLPRQPPNEDKDLFEASHAVCLAILERSGAVGRVVQEFATWYGAALIGAYPDPIDYDILRRGFILSVRACSFASSATASASLGMNAVQQAEEVEGSEESIVPDNSNALFNAPTTFDDVTGSDNDAEEDAIFANATPPAPAQQDSESDILAWSLIARLLSKIQDLNYLIAHPELQPQPVFNSDGVKGQRIDLILDASPLTRLNLHRDQLGMVLCETIRVVGLNGLDGVLEVLESLLLRGFVPAWALPDAVVGSKGASNGDRTSPVGADDVKSPESGRPAAAQEHSECTSTAKYTYAGLGIQTNPDTSPLWKLLIKTIGQARGFDYARKTKCVGWYMNMLHVARGAWKQYSRERQGRQNTGEESIAKPLFHGHTLRARL